MSIEVRANGRLYLYTARRTAGRLRKTYHGRLSEEQAVAERAAADERKAERRRERELVLAADRGARAVLEANAEFDRLAEKLFRAVMAVMGYHLHARTAWRKRKGATPMSPIEALVERYGPPKPKPALITFEATTPADQEVLDRAARGDTSVLPQVREWLKNPVRLSWLGSVASMAEHAIVQQVAGDNVAVAEAVAAKMRDQRERLLAETPNASLPVKLAVTRVVHNWVTVHCLEATAAKHTPGSPSAVAVERQLASAERRLATALKSLTVLRRLSRGTAVDAAKDAMKLEFLRKIGKAPSVLPEGG